MRIKPGIYLVLFILGFSFTVMPQAAAAPSLQEQKTLEYISEMDSDLYRALPAIRTKSVADYNAILEVYKKRIEKIKVLSMAPLLGEAIHRIHTGMSIGAMFP